MHLLLIVILGVLIAHWLMTPSRGGGGCGCLCVLFVLMLIGMLFGGGH